MVRTQACNGDERGSRGRRHGLRPTRPSVRPVAAPASASLPPHGLSGWTGANPPRHAADCLQLHERHGDTSESRQRCRRYGLARGQSYSTAPHTAHGPLRPPASPGGSGRVPRICAIMYKQPAPLKLSLPRPHRAPKGLQSVHGPDSQAFPAPVAPELDRCSMCLAVDISCRCTGRACSTKNSRASIRRAALCTVQRAIDTGARRRSPQSSSSTCKMAQCVETVSTRSPTHRRDLTKHTILRRQEQSVCVACMAANGEGAWESLMLPEPPCRLPWCPWCCSWANKH